MNDILPIGGLATSATLRDFANAAPGQIGQAGRSADLSDRVEISELAGFLNRLAELPDVRARHLVNVRSAILTGTYETPEKLDIAISRLLHDLTQNP